MSLATGAITGQLVMVATGQQLGGPVAGSVLTSDRALGVLTGAARPTAHVEASDRRLATVVVGARI